MGHQSNRMFIPIAAATTFGAVYVMSPPAGASADREPTLADLTYYPNCSAARAAGAAPIYRGEPGYREGMDGDNDGIACEPYRGR